MNTNRPLEFRVWDEKYKAWDAPGTHMVYPENLRIQGRILTQFTGLLDKNGKKIFEGDILKEPAYGRRYDYDPIIIEYKDYRGEENTVCGLVLPEEPEECEIIGNIFENPELLK